MRPPELHRRRDCRVRIGSRLTAVCLAGLTVFGVRSEDLFRYQAWKGEQGLPQNTVKAIKQTEDGYLWFTTRFGIVRFDGITFHVLDRSSRPDLPSDSFLALVEDRKDHSLWLADAKSVIRIKNESFESFPICAGTAMDYVHYICPSRGGGLWIATMEGLKRLDQGKLSLVAASEDWPNDRIRTMFEDNEGVLWIATPAVVRLRDPATGGYTVVWRSATPSEASVSCLCKSLDGSLWIGTAAAGLKHLRDGVVITYDASNLLPSNTINFIAQDHETNLWIGLGNGKLGQLRNGVLTTYGKQEGLSDDSVTCFLEDKERNLWVGTEYGGLNRMQPRRFLTYSTDDGIGDHHTWSIAEGKNGRLWIGTAGGLTCFQNGTFTNHQLGEGEVDNDIKAVMEDSSGNVWAGTRSDGIRIFRDGTVSYVSGTGRRDHDQINAVYEDRSRTVWVGTFMGLDRFENGKLSRRYLVEDGLADNDVRAILEARNGDLWIATYRNGLSRMHDGRFKTFTTRDGLSDNTAWMIREDDEGVLWIGTEKGLTRMKDGKFTSLTKEQGLFDNTINDVLGDGLGYMWIGCNRGIYRVNRKQLMDVADGLTNKVNYLSYGASDGMLSSETNGENQPAACKTADGRLWFPTTDGIVAIDPAKTTRNDVPPPVVIEVVQVGGKQVDPSKFVRLPPGSGAAVDFRYTANSFSAPEKVRFKYWLVGWDSSWKEAGSRREASYNNLTPGDYKFRVRACNNHDIWSDQDAEFAFYIEPHVYQTKLFYAFAAFSLVLLAYGLHRLRVNVVTKIQRLEQQHALEKERTRIAKEMHDDLGSSLTQIALTSEMAGRAFSDHSTAGEHLRKITGTTREVFRAMDEIVWAVNPKHDTLDSLVAYVGKYAQRFLQTAGVRCRFDFPDQLPTHTLTAEERHNLFLAFKEALNNIVKHASASEVWIHVQVRDGDCILTIEDDGRGFDAQSARPDGNGLHNMRERLNAIGGTFELSSLADQGTRLQMTVSLKKTRQGIPRW